MTQNPLILLQKYGQSFWYDNISRNIIHSGELQRMIEQEGLRGVTSNPTIFYKAISSGSEYDEQLKEIFFKNNILSEKEIFYELAIKDVKDACDIFMGIYQESNGDDGYVSIEIDPHLAYDTEGTIVEATKLFERCGKANIMIKVPATKEGIFAIEELIYKGVNINATLIFSIKRYEEVINSYLNGLERRLYENKDINNIASVASFFVSRIDTLIDKYLKEKLKDCNRENINNLFGKAAISCAKIAYQVFKKVFSSERFFKLRLKGAKVQRLLFGSTSTKNPSYSDVLYVEELIGPGTINTMPDITWRAFKEHGKVNRTLDADLHSAEEVINKLENIGISIDAITEKLEEEGVKLFIESFDSIINIISEKKKCWV